MRHQHVFCATETFLLPKKVYALWWGATYFSAEALLYFPRASEPEFWCKGNNLGYKLTIKTFVAKFTYKHKYDEALEQFIR